jgi:hypothetical protein
MNQAPSRSKARVRRCGNGFAAEGPGYFVWDPDESAVAEAARLLSRGALPLRTPERMLIVGAAAAGSAASEALDR